jgi:hypothetical protein
MTKCELILNALKTALEDGLAAKIERNAALPEKIPGSGLLILRDGAPGEPEQSLGGFGAIYCRQDAEVEIYVESGDAAFRCRAPRVSTSELRFH